MKIIFIIQNIARSAGTEKATIQLADSFVRKGLDTEIISLESTLDSEPFFTLANKIPIHHLGKGKAKIAILLKIKKILERSKADIICGTGHNISFFLPFIKNRGSKTIALEHIDFDSIPPFSRALMRLSYPKLNAVVVVSEIAKMKVSKLFNRVEFIPNQIKITGKQSSLEEHRIILVGRISMEKGYERLVPIAHQLQNKLPHWKIDIYGGCEDDYQNHLEKLISTNNLENIRIHSPIKNIEDEYLQSSIFMITSKFEAFGLVILEAKSYGLPIIGFRNQGTQSLIKDNEDGFIVDTEAEAFSKIELLISDIQLRNRLVRNGLVNVREYAEEKIMGKWITLINSL